MIEPRQNPVLEIQLVKNLGNLLGKNSVAHTHTDLIYCMFGPPN